MIKLFVSYSHKDRKLVNRIVNELGSFGFDIWVDQNEIIGGESIRATIENTIKETDVFLIAISSKSILSKWVQEEIDMIFDRAKSTDSVIVPILLDQCDVPQALRGRKWIAFYNNYKKAINELQRTLVSWAIRKKDRLLENMEQNLINATDKSRKDISLEYSAIGNIALGCASYKEATEIFRKSIDKWNRNWDAYHLLATALIKIGQFEEAENILKTLIARKTQIGRAYYNFACLASRRAEKNRKDTTTGT